MLVKISFCTGNREFSSVMLVLTIILKKQTLYRTWGCLPAAEEHWTLYSSVCGTTEVLSFPGSREVLQPIQVLAMTFSPTLCLPLMLSLFIIARGLLFSHCLLCPISGEGKLNFWKLLRFFRSLWSYQSQNGSLNKNYRVSEQVCSA